MDTFTLENIEHDFADMENALEDMSARMEEEFEVEMMDHLVAEPFPLVVEPNDDLNIFARMEEEEEFGVLPVLPLGENVVDDVSRIQQLPVPVPLPTLNSSQSHMTGTSNSLTPTITGRYAMLRNALLDPVKEWRKVPEEFRNDKLFILQFLYKSNLHQLPLPSKDDFERKFPYYVRQDRDIIYAISQRFDFAKIYTTRHSYVPEQYKDDKYIMMSYCKTIQRSLQECSYRLQDDIDVVTTAIQNDGMELQYASSAMQQNEMIVRQACDSNICALDFCSSKPLRDKLLCDCDFVAKMLRTAGESGINDVVVDDQEDFKPMNMQMKYASKVLRNLVEPLRSNKELLLIGIQYNILSYTELSKNTLKYQNDIDFLIESISRRASVYLELCQIPSKEHWYKSTTTVVPILPGNSCGAGGYDISKDHNMNFDSHRIAYTTITSSTSDATIIAKVLENIPTFLTSPEYQYNDLVHEAIVDRADIPYLQEHLNTKFPYLRSNIDIMIRAIQRDCNLFVICTEKDEPAILTAAMNAETAYPLLHTKPMSYVLEHIDDVLMHVISVSKTYDVLGPIIPDNVWNNNIALQRAWIKRKGSLLPSTVQLLNRYSTINIDTQMNPVICDLALYIAEHNSRQFYHVPLSLRSDVNFMITAIQLSSGNVMQYGGNTIQQNMECAIHTIACSVRGTAFNYIRHFTPQQIYDHIQTTLFYHDAFVNPILCTICQTEYGRNDLLSDEYGETRTIIPLQILNCGPETSTALTQRIASFVGLPIGPTFKIYEKAHRNVYHYLHMNVTHRPHSTMTNVTAATNHVTVGNVPPRQQPPAFQAVEPAPVQNRIEFQRLVDRLRRVDAHARPAFHPGHQDDDDDDDDFALDVVDDEIEMMELEEMALAEDLIALDGQLNRLPVDNIAAAVDLAQNPQPPPDTQPANEIERFILANVVEHAGQPPVVRANDRLLDPLLRLGRLDEHRAIIRTIRRRRVRNNNGQPNIHDGEEEIHLLRALLGPRLR